MDDRTLQHQPITERSRWASSICRNCPLGACRRIPGPFGVFKALAFRSRQSISLEFPGLLVYPPDNVLWNANPDLHVASRSICSNESYARATARAACKLAGRAPLFTRLPKSPLERSRIIAKFPVHTVDYDSANALALRAGIEAVLLAAVGKSLGRVNPSIQAAHADGGRQNMVPGQASTSLVFNPYDPSGAAASAPTLEDQPFLSIYATGESTSQSVPFSDPGIGNALVPPPHAAQFAAPVTYQPNNYYMQQYAHAPMGNTSGSTSSAPSDGVAHVPVGIVVLQNQHNVQVAPLSANPVYPSVPCWGVPTVLQHAALYWQHPPTSDRSSADTFAPPAPYQAEPLIQGLFVPYNLNEYDQNVSDVYPGWNGTYWAGVGQEETGRV